MCPQAKIPEQLSLPPRCLSFYPFILSCPFSSSVGKGSRVPSKLPNIHFEIYPPPPTNPSQIRISSFLCFPPTTLSLPVLVWLLINLFSLADFSLSCGHIRQDNLRYNFIHPEGNCCAAAVIQSWKSTY